MKAEDVEKTVQVIFDRFPEIMVGGYNPPQMRRLLAFVSREFAAEQLEEAAMVLGNEPWKQKVDDTESDWLRARAAELRKASQ